MIFCTYLLFSVLHTILLSLYILYHLNQFCSAPLVTSKLFDSLFLCLPMLKFSFVLGNYDICLNSYCTRSSERLREAFRNKKLKTMSYFHLMRTLNIKSIIVLNMGNFTNGQSVEQNSHFRLVGLGKVCG